MSESRAVPTVRIDNETVRVTEWRFVAGAATGLHRHEHPYVVVPLTSGDLAAVTREGTATATLGVGVPYFRDAGVEHDVRNVNAFEFAFVEIEIKR